MQSGTVDAIECTLGVEDVNGTVKVLLVTSVFGSPEIEHLFPRQFGEAPR